MSRHLAIPHQVSVLWKCPHGGARAYMCKGAYHGTAQNRAEFKITLKYLSQVKN